jgi:GT2 family glycosyltransferase
VFASTSDYICLIDEKITGFKSGWLRKLMGQAIQQGVGAVSPKLIDAHNNRVWSNGIVLIPGKTPLHLSRGEERKPNGYFGWAKLTRGYSALSERCLLFKREHFIMVKGFNEIMNTPNYYGVDFCLKLRELGYRNILRPLVELTIQSEKVINQDIDPSSEVISSDKAYFDKTWHKWLNNDPGFNPNLDIIDEKFLINLDPKKNASRKTV